eukprot:2935164-Pleurochrysis_carterae.AAC.3
MQGEKRLTEGQAQAWGTQEKLAFPWMGGKGGPEGSSLGGGKRSSGRGPTPRRWRRPGGCETLETMNSPID